MVTGGKIRPVNFHILKKDYVVACPEEEYDTLTNAAQYLNKKIHEIRESGRIVSSERLVAISALNIIHEYFQYKQEQMEKESSLNRQIKHLESKIDLALDKVK